MEKREFSRSENAEKIDFRDVVIFTTTLYGEDESSKIRSALALDLFARAGELGIKIIVVDGGSGDDFLDKTRGFKNVSVIVEKDLNMGDSRRFALKKAMDEYPDSSYFLWMEPEKADLIKEENLVKMLKNLRSHEADIVVPRRKSTESMPHFQAWIETRANKRASGVLPPRDKDDGSSEFDLWFGPKIFNREGAQYFLKDKGKKWESIIRPVVDAAKDGMQVDQVEVDFNYPALQTDNEDDDPEFKKKRLSQYRSILKELGDPFWSEKGEKSEKERDGKK